MRTFKVIAKVLAVVVAAVCVNALLTFALVPYGSKSEVVWSEYRQTDDVDMLFVGDSLIAQSADPAVFDAALGTHSFNMSTPGQSLQSSYSGIAEVIGQHELKRVVLGVELSELYGGRIPVTGVFEHEKGKGEPVWEQVQNWSTLAKTQDWLNDPSWISITLFPWQIQRVSLPEVPANVVSKLDGTPVTVAGEAAEPGWNYYGRGYGNYTNRFDSRPVLGLYTFSQTMDPATVPLDEEYLTIVDDICDLCREAGVELEVYVPPLPDYLIVDCGSAYQRLSDQVKDYVNARGVQFFDFNLVKRDLFDNDVSYFADYEHLNTEGAKAFSGLFAEVLQTLDAGGSADGFFTSYDDHVSGIDTVASVALQELSSTDDGITVKLRVARGPDVPVECRLLARGPGDEGLVVVRDWDESTECTFYPEEHGVYDIRAEVRKAGDEDASRDVSGSVVF